MSHLFCIKISQIPIHEVSYLISKAFVKSGKTNIGDKRSFSFNKLNALYSSISYLKPTNFFNNVKGAARVLKFLTKHL